MSAGWDINEKSIPQNWVKLAVMRNVHLLIADLFLPETFADEVCAGLQLPALEKMLARGRWTNPVTDCSMEDVLCGMFGVDALAPVSAAFDGLGEGCWLRADPVYMRLQREQVVMLPNGKISADEAMQFCASLNEHFTGQGVEFLAPHPARWYLRMNESPDITTVPISQAAGCSIHGNLPKGADAGRWNQLFNEIQMLLFAHPLNEAREARGEAPVNSVWFWGNGEAGQAKSICERISSDQVLVEMLAAAADIPFSDWRSVWREEDQLLVWTGLRTALQRGDLAAWRDALQQFETGYAQPIWRSLRDGKIASLRIDILGGDSLQQLRLARFDAWAFWRRSKRLPDYSLTIKPAVAR